MLFLQAPMAHWCHPVLPSAHAPQQHLRLLPPAPKLSLGGEGYFLRPSRAISSALAAALACSSFSLARSSRTFSIWVGTSSDRDTLLALFPAAGLLVAGLVGQGDACPADASSSSGLALSGRGGSPEPRSARLLLGGPGSSSVAPAVSCRVSLPPSPARGAGASCSWLSPVQPLSGTPRSTRRVSGVLQRSAASSACEEHRAAAERGSLSRCHGPQRAGHVPSPVPHGDSPPPCASWPCLAVGVTSLLESL